jgi:hypothetical protein
MRRVSQCYTSENSLPRHQLGIEVIIPSDLQLVFLLQMQNEQLHLSQHVSKYTQPSVLILQHLLGTTYIPLEVSRPPYS